MQIVKQKLTTDAGVQKVISNPFASIFLAQVNGTNNVILGNVPATRYALRHKETKIYDAGILRVAYAHQFATANRY